MSPNTAEAVRARADRRRHLQQRQTVIFGVIAAALLVIGLFAAGVWTGVVPSPVNVPIASPSEEGGAAETQPFPCPPADTLPVPYGEITANVLNGTSVVGLAGQTAAELAAFGVGIGSQDNAETYAGTANIVAGTQGIAAAYTIAALFPDPQVTLDGRGDGTIDIILGAAFEDMVPKDQIELDPTVPIPAPGDCTPAEEPEGDGDDG